MTRPRLRATAIVVLVVVECLFLAYLVAFGWTFRNLMLHPGDPEIAVRIRTVGINAAWLALTLLAGLAYVVRRDGFGRYALFVVLGLDVGNAVFAAVAAIVNGDPGTAIGWMVEAVIPAAALLLIWRSPGEARVSTGG